MKTLLKLEELGMFLLGLYLFIHFLPYAWWWFWLLLLSPDVGMVGYIINPKVGSFTYNLLHHKTIGASLIILGLFLGNNLINFMGIIIFVHASLDRVFGYGLKFPDSFKNTHLGRLS